MTQAVDDALSLWGLEGAECSFVAGRENRVYRVKTVSGDYALRIKRRGYREEAELHSELVWLKAMDDAGLHVPRPFPSLAGCLLERTTEGFIDLVGWLPGTTMGKSRTPLALGNRTGAFHALGLETARLHSACDAWERPPEFQRCHWNIDGLLGETPVWGRFWENPTLDPDTRALFLNVRQVARRTLTNVETALDYGLIHADLVRENVLLDGGTIRMIDFDDGGFGFRLFDLATILLRNLAEPDYPSLKAALVEGYLSHRALDLSLLDLFIALRALSYVGWIVPRISEDGGAERNLRYVAEAADLCTDFLRENVVHQGGGKQ